MKNIFFLIIISIFIISCSKNEISKSKEECTKSADTTSSQYDFNKSLKECMSRKQFQLKKETSNPTNDDSWEKIPS